LLHRKGKGRESRSEALPYQIRWDCVWMQEELQEQMSQKIEGQKTMASVTHDLTIRLDESAKKLVFFATRKVAASEDDSKGFSIEIELADLKNRGEVGAERLIGESVLGFFDHLTDGHLDLPRHYRDT
jgi:hypothetical protein